MIPLNECRPLGLYRLQSRNLDVGVFSDDWFFGVREKAGHHYLEAEFHPEARDGDRGFARPVELIGECPVAVFDDKPALLAWLREKREAAADHLIEVRPDGSLHFLYDDALTGLMEAGPARACRVSHVEPTAVDDRVVWYADMRPVAGPNLGPFDTRDDALRAERAWLNSNRLPDPK